MYLTVLKKTLYSEFELGFFGSKLPVQVPRSYDITGLVYL